MERRLAAILAADVVGYSALMEADEAGTLAALKRLRADLVDPAVARHKGRIVKLMGDGMLAEFASVVDAVGCAVAVQRALAQERARAIRLRIGINLGDVIVEGADLYGGGVNLAARLEGLAAPGGITLSGPAYEMARGKLDLVFEDLGLRRVKNIAAPLRVYRVVLEGAAPPQSAPSETVLALPDKPSLAVLPFANMSADPEQAFFAEGIAEDIITELSKFRSLFVIARNSSFAFKGQALEVKEVGAKLGVRYLVEGSVRRAGRRVRITAQLIDAVADQHLWAERYDRDLEDIFAVQDEVTAAIVTAIEPTLASSERQRARRRPTASLDAWESTQRGLWHLHLYTAQDTERGLAFMRRAIALDPTFAAAQAGLAFGLYCKVLFGFSADNEGDLARGLEAGKTAVMLDETDPFAYVALARVQTRRGEHNAAIAACERAIALNPNYASAYQGRAHSLWHAGRPAEAIASHDEAMRLSPHDPLMWVFMASKSIALSLLGRTEEALAWAEKAQRQPNAALFAYVAGLAALGLLGRADAARNTLAAARRVKPDLSLGFVKEALPISDPACFERFFGALATAGLGE